MEFRERRLSAQDGLRLYLRDYGDPLSDRTPVLCLGGLSRNSKDFHQLAVRLATDRRVVCPDYRGRGRSEYDKDWRNYTASTYINDILHILAALNLHRVIVIGTSLGGLLAMGLGAAAPTALAGVVLNDVGPDVDPDGLASIIAYLSSDKPQPDLETAAAAMRELIPDLSHRDEKIWYKLAENTYRPDDDGLLHFDWDPAIIKPIVEKHPIPDLWSLFRALRHVPVLAVRGELSKLLTPQCFDRMAEEMPEISRITVASTGHAPTLDEPDIRDDIHDFVANL